MSEAHGEESHESVTQRLNRHDEEIDELRGGQTALQRAIDGLRDADQKLVDDIAQIKAQLGLTATKTDLALMQAQIQADFHTTINGTLKDALEAVPGKFMLILTGIGSIVALAAFLISRWHG